MFPLRQPGGVVGKSTQTPIKQASYGVAISDYANWFRVSALPPPGNEFAGGKSINASFLSKFHHSASCRDSPSSMIGSLPRSRALRTPISLSNSLLLLFMAIYDDISVVIN